MRKGLRILFNADGGNGGGGTDGGGKDDGGGRARDDRKRGELQQSLSDLQDKFDTLQKKHGELEKVHGDTQKELGTFKSEKARRTALEDRIKDVTKAAEKAGKKIEIDKDLAFKYLNKGEFDPKTLESEVDDAISMFTKEKGKPTSGVNGNEPAGDAKDTGKPELHPMNKLILEGLGRR